MSAFNVELCSAATMQQTESSVVTRPRSNSGPTRSSSSARRTDPRRHAEAEKKSRRLRQVASDRDANSLVYGGISRGDQSFAASMLVTEAWRHGRQQQDRLNAKGSNIDTDISANKKNTKTSPTMTTAVPPVPRVTATNKRLIAQLLKDVSQLMSSKDMWADEATLGRVNFCNETHPYLFTMNELNKVRLFAPIISSSSKTAPRVSPDSSYSS